MSIQKYDSDDENMNFTPLLRAHARQYGGERGEAAFFAPLERRLI